MFSKLLKSLRGAGLTGTGSDDGDMPEAFQSTTPDAFAANGAYDSDEIVRQFQHDRNSHVIGIIHRHADETERWDQWIWDALIGGHHLQDFMTAMEAVPPTAKLDIILHSIGGFNLPVQLIARAIKAHRGETTVFVPHYAHDISTLIALAADKIVMGPAASMSYLEPDDEVLSKVVQQKGLRRVADETLLKLSVAKLHARELRAFITEITAGRVRGSQAKLLQALTGGKASPWDPLTVPAAQQMGLPVTTDMPASIFRLIQACRAAPARDKGIKTVDRSVGASRVSALAMSDISTIMRHGAVLPPLDGSRGSWRVSPEPVQYATSSHSDDDDEDPSGVALENCDITIRPLIARLEQVRNSRVVCVIHQPGMESHSVDTVTTEDILTALQSTPADKPLDIVLHTPGGYSYQAHQIALAVKAHRAKTTVFVPYFAMSGGTIISLAVDEIVMSPTAALGPIDSQFSLRRLHGSVPSRALVDLLKTKPRHKIDDEFLELGMYCERLIPQDHKNALELMKGTYAPSTADRIAHTLNDGTLTHGYPVTFSEAKKLGLHVNTAMPPEAVAIVRAYRRNRWGKRSVVFCG
jgi:ClpP class serine protease